jgi:enoyl-[acyl-carrier protein] reductase III
MSSQHEVALITGGSRGMGRALAHRLAASGLHVVVNYRRDDAAAAEVVADIRAAGGHATAVQADVADPDAVAAMFEQVRDEHGRLDVLVANAAASAFKPLTEIREHHVDKTMAITVTGFLRLVQQALELMGPGGRVVAVSGWDSFRVLPGHGLLGAAKAAMEALVKYLAVELGERDVSVVGVCPGPVDTDSFRFYAGDDWDDYERHWVGQTPRGRFPGPDEIAEVLEFFASPASRWITGQTVVVDGGLSLTTMPLNSKDAAR